MNTDEYDTGMGTTPGMWQMVSDALDGEKLPASINSAIGALCDGEAAVEPQNQSRFFCEKCERFVAHDHVIGGCGGPVVKLSISES